MRLIDADALIKDLRELLYTDENPSKQLTDAGQAIHNAAIALAASEVTDAPTIDAAPMVHARWKRYFVKAGEEFNDHAYCSTCQKASTAWAPDLADVMRYCFHCGAKMDEKKDGK